jgi:large subunit ribosomal protein L34
MPKRTWQPKKRKRARTHGFRKRMKSRGGRDVIKARRRKGRKKLATQPKHVKNINWNAG